MDRALFLLLRLRLKAWFRKALRSLASVKGILLVLVGSMAFVPSLVAGLLAPADPGALEGTRRFAPFFLLAYCLITLAFSAGETAFSFSPAEVNLLFAGPFSRRQILVYKIGNALGLALITATFMTIFLRRNAAWTLAAYVGMILAFMFLQLFTMTVALASSTLGETAKGWRRKTALAVVVALIGVFAWSAGRDAIVGVKLDLATLERIESSPAVGVALAPFRWFMLAFTAENPRDLLKWSALGLLVDLGLVAAVMGLDAQYLEAAEAASARRYARIERKLRGQAFASPTRRKSGKLQAAPPGLPWLGGAGPIVWRQLTGAIRSPGQMVALLLLFSLLSVGGVAASLSMGGDLLAPAMPGALILLMFVVPTMLPFDFRGDVERMEVLKTLPIRPAMMALGQILSPVLLLTVPQTISLTIIAVSGGKLGLLYWAALAFGPVFYLLVFTVENLMFLWFPVRMIAVTPGDIQTIGRVYLLMLAKILALLLTAVPASLAGALVYFLIGRNWPAALAASWLFLLASTLALLPLVAQAFRRFDVARDSPA